MKRDSSQRSTNYTKAALLGSYKTHYHAFEKTYKRSIPFVLLLQIGKFLETYDESARIISRELSMRLGTKGVDRNDWAGFPIGSAETHTQTLAKRGYAVIKMIQTENSETKKQRTSSSSSSSSSSHTNRVTLPAETICMVSDKPLAIVQGNTILFYFADTNTYKELLLDTTDQLICKMMEHQPCELIISSHASSIKSIRHLFTDCYIRQYFELGFSPIHTLQKYLTILSRTDLLPTLEETSCQTNIPTMEIDARTALNLTLFDKKGSLLESLSNTMTRSATSVLRHMLYNPLHDDLGIKRRQTRLKHLIGNHMLDIVHQNKPKSISLATSRHPLFKTKPDEFVTTEENVSKFLNTIQKSILEVQLWQKWVQLLKRADIAVSILFPDMPPLSDMKSGSDKEELASELKRFNQRHSFTAVVVKTGLYKNLFETDVANESLVAQDNELKIQSKTQKLIRFDSRAIQCARLACSETAIRNVMENAATIKLWLKLFQKNYTPDFFELFSESECFVCLAYYFKYNDQTTTWPVFNDRMDVEGMELPQNMTPRGQKWVPNDFKQTKFILLKGCNGSGKTTYMRTLAINSLLAHCGLPVFAQSFQTTLLDSLFMRIGSSDSLAEGKSSFVVEMEHMRDIAAKMTQNSALFIDELGCSCDSESGKKICEHFIRKIKEKNPVCIFATHFDIKDESGREMGMTDQGEYTYMIQDYGQNQSNKNALAVAERCGFPASVLYHAERLLR